MKIIVDAMGGDFAPQAPVEGAINAVNEFGVDVLLVGRENAIRASMEQLGYNEIPAGIEIMHTQEVVEVEDNPATVMKEKKDASMNVGLKLLKEDKADAFVSAGSTGALLSMATLIIKRIKGIRRAALAPVLPTEKGSAILIDAGATAEATPEYLLQYAFMGSYYAKRFLDLPNPRVGMLNIGAEPNKGMDFHKHTYELLQKAHKEGKINFTGNIEAKEAVLGHVDVIVTDGFTGNILLKTFEGTAMYIKGLLKNVFEKNIKTKLAAGLVLKEFGEMKKGLDPNETGGTPLLGISKSVVKAHGSSNAYAIKNAIRQTLVISKSGLIEDIKQNVEHMSLEHAHDA